MKRPDREGALPDDERRERFMKEAKAATVAFRLKPELREALDKYLLDHPRENQTNLMIFLLERELRRLDYLRSEIKQLPDLFAEVSGSKASVEQVSDELERLALSLTTASRRLRPDP